MAPTENRHKTHPAIHLKLQLTKTAISAWNQKESCSTPLPCSAFAPASQKGTVLSAGCSLMSQSHCPSRSQGAEEAWERMCPPHPGRLLSLSMLPASSPSPGRPAAPSAAVTTASAFVLDVVPHCFCNSVGEANFFHICWLSEIWFLCSHLKIYCLKFSCCFIRHSSPPHNALLRFNTNPWSTKTSKSFQISQGIWPVL